ncbi:hypothetical protein IFM89_028151 [Coptis chinensis]|uniref:Uncharacterized protein n=1 Tax=Coptis chinensis TaxID=261450 RepID=A0A835LTB0_9MAGN|nr:hypothetical protein IFM89_028151 [Coptis chinensis]
MNAPFTAVYFATYEAMKKVLSEISLENASEEQILVHLTTGGVAGALASQRLPLHWMLSKPDCNVRLPYAGPRMKP